MRYKIKNWQDHQHFKDRTPPWIKLHRDLLNDPEWYSLDGDTAKSLIMIWLIASEDKTMSGTVPDVKTLAFRLRKTEKEVNQILTKLSNWMYQDDIKLISSGNQVDIPETETETETETDIIVPSGTPDCPHERIVSAYHELLPTLSGVKILTDKRKALLKARWRDDEKRQSLEWWNKYFKYVSTIPFLLGDNDRNWQVDFEWLINSSNLVKVIEGKYENRKS